MLNKFGKVIENASLINYNTYGISTSCNYLIKPDNIDNLISLIEYLNNNDVKYYLLGCGSNVILPDNHFNGVIISLELLNNIKFDGNLVIAECGVSLGVLVANCINKSLEGLEYLALIPGTLGGALYGNAGVKDYTIYDNLISVEVVRDNKLVKLLKDDIGIGYRHSSFKDNNDILVRAIFELKKGNINDLKDIVKENRLKRQNSQPLEFKNAGSVFKNPEGDYAGRLIESVGLKGYSVGDAEVSTKHANFIINKGHATGSDIRKLIQIIKEKVYNEYKIDLVLEQIIIDWD
ncbi:MAG: UDP-N-acetylmuramate dehydrogenase [Firmicutes bacterium]|nr:UDP-N-acetylmuramate dehydrogenase [Bacillota bacterium]